LKEIPINFYERWFKNIILNIYIIFILILDLDSDIEEDDEDEDDDSTPIPQISNDSQLSEDSIESFRLQKAG
jgi:hypothetical protein